jgi:3-hydroxybutyryl-CoA dehydratase
MSAIEEHSHFTVGEEATLSKRISDADIKAFAQISGDANPIHLDDEYARGTHFGGRIAHGMLAAALISAVLGTRLPGPGAIYLSQTLCFTAPVHPGDMVTARVRVTDWDASKGQIKLVTEVLNQDGTIVITGEAQLVMSAFLGAR